MFLDTSSTQNRRIIDFTKYGFHDLQILGKYNYNKIGNKLRSHRHKGMLEICYLDKGSQFFDVDGHKFLVKGGDVFLHFPGELHGSGDHPEEKGVLYWIIIRMGKSSGNNFLDLCELLVERKKRHFKVGKEIKKKLEEIYSIHIKKESNKLKKLRILVKTQSLLLTLLDAIDNEKKQTDNERLNKIQYFIHNSLTENISIPVLAKEMNLSESRFKNLFKELTGFTPMDYIQREKVEIALNRIAKDPSISFTDLAYELNFSSPQYFSTVVKKYTGNSPGFIKSNQFK